ncbi:MAG: 2'-5' RNA ligase family protein, partial [Sphingobacteriales bacterium]
PGLAQPAFEKMVKRLHALPPIELHLNGFGFFNQGETARTIYAAVEKTAHTDNWFRLLKKQLGIRVENFVPHITIARNIPVTSFSKLWPDFENRPFSETFTANSLTILQKETFVDYCEWTHYRELFFADKLAIF